MRKGAAAFAGVLGLAAGGIMGQRGNFFVGGLWLIAATLSGAAPVVAPRPAWPPSASAFHPAGALVLPARGIREAAAEGKDGRPQWVPPDSAWRCRPATVGTLCVATDGPRGSGRFWDVVVGAARRGGGRPARGLHLTTSTAGWRTLGAFARTPLPWLEDLDGDGAAEFILWDSFPLGDDAAGAAGLVAWVYRRAARDTLALDRELSRGLIRELVAAYRPPADALMRGLRRAAADSLETLLRD